MRGVDAKMAAEQRTVKSETEDIIGSLPKTGLLGRARPPFYAGDGLLSWSDYLSLVIAVRSHGLPLCKVNDGFQHWQGRHEEERSGEEDIAGRQPRPMRPR